MSPATLCEQRQQQDQGSSSSEARGKGDRDLIYYSDTADITFYFDFNLGSGAAEGPPAPIQPIDTGRLPSRTQAENPRFKEDRVQEEVNT